jgi:hypothetical protein
MVLRIQNTPQPPWRQNTAQHPWRHDLPPHPLNVLHPQHPLTGCRAGPLKVSAAHTLGPLKVSGLVHQQPVPSKVSELVQLSPLQVSALVHLGPLKVSRLVRSIHHHYRENFSTFENVYLRISATLSRPKICLTPSLTDKRPSVSPRTSRSGGGVGDE